MLFQSSVRERCFLHAVTSQRPLPVWLLCLCLWAAEWARMQGRMVRAVPPRPQRAMTCVINTFMFDWLHCSLKLAWRKWDFPSQNITLHPSSKPSIKVLYSSQFYQFYKSHQTLPALHRSDQNKVTRHNKDCIPWKPINCLMQAHAVIPALQTLLNTAAQTWLFNYLHSNINCKW